MCYFTAFYFQHLPKKSTILSLQYYTFPIFCLVSINMVILGFTVAHNHPAEQVCECDGQLQPRQARSGQRRKHSIN